MKTILLILLLIVSVSAQHSVSDLGINTSYDKFRDVSTVKLTESLMPDSNGYLYLLFSVVAEIKGQDVEHTPPSSVVIVISSFTEGWYFLRTENVLRVIQDEQRYELGKMDRDGAVTRGGVFETLALAVPFSAIEQLSRSFKVEIQVGRYQTELKPSAIENLKAWVKLFPNKPK